MVIAKPTMEPRACNILLVYPRFAAETFWNFAATCKIFGARCPAPPLGLITVAALLPSSWTVRLVDRNAEKLTEDQLEWADLVMTGGMLPQQHDLLDVIDLCHAKGKSVVVGGPAVTSTPQIYAAADFRVLGEAEGVIDEFIAAWLGGAKAGYFEAKKFTVDVTKSPIPRFDLLNFEYYLHIGVQFSRGCPFTCEFCDIIELYGRVPRAKTNSQMLAELDELYRAGYRGHVDFVDDNLIGNKKAVRTLMPELRAWLERNDYPFEFTTEASVNLADDDSFLKAMSEANFVGVFMGIESPDTDTLIAMRKKQNTRRSLVESIKKIYAAGIFVTAGFIVGFDNEKGSIADGMIELIEEAAIPVCMVGLLYALPNTQLTRRLAKEGRLHPTPASYPPGTGDQCTQGLNFETVRPRQEVLLDYKRILEKIYDPVAYAGRLERLSNLLDHSNRKRRTSASDSRRRFNASDMLHRIVNNLPEPREIFWPALKRCVAGNPQSARWIVALTALYLHMGPFSRHVIGQIEQKIENLAAGADSPRSVYNAGQVEAAAL
ncbi:MAG: B12-binding domain-containing radical SAM protein [Alphaproteobacteria bacterium]